MSLAFPKTDLMQQLTLASGRLVPMWRQERSVQAGGAVLVKDLGPMLWRANYTTVPLSKTAALDLETELMTLQGGLHLFEGYDPRRALPLSDQVSPLGAVTVSEVRADRKALKLAGLPVGFKVSKSDYLSIDDGTNLHLMRVGTGQIADASGVTGDIDVTPFVRSGISVGQTVKLRYPSARFMIEKDSVSSDRVGGFHYAISFSALQVIT